MYSDRKILHCRKFIDLFMFLIMSLLVDWRLTKVLRFSIEVCIKKFHFMFSLYSQQVNLFQKFNANIIVSHAKHNTILQASKCGIVEAIQTWMRFKQQTQLNQKCSGAKRSKLRGIPKLDDANDAGTKNSIDCTPDLDGGWLGQDAGCRRAGSGRTGSVRSVPAAW